MMNKEVLHPESCRYCDAPVVLSTGADIGWFSERLRKIRLFVCSNFPACDAFVGCHPGTIAPLGWAANPETREARHRVHYLYLDPLWKYIEVFGLYDNANPPRHIARNHVYLMLCRDMDLTRIDTHVAKFDLDQCNEAIEHLDRVYRGNMSLVQFRDNLLSKPVYHISAYYANPQLISP